MSMHATQYQTSGPLLTADEERALGLRRMAGDAAAAGELVRRNIRLAISQARRAECPPGVDRDDLIQAGMVGLAEAARRFDPIEKPGIRFSTYATYWVRQMIRLARIDEGSMIRPDRPFLEAAYRRSKGRTLEARHEKSLARERHRATGDDQDAAIAVAPAPCDDAESWIDVADAAAMVERAMVFLTDRERIVIRGRCFSCPVRTLSDIARDIRVSKERVRQIETIALATLRRKIGVHEGGRTA